MSIWRHTSTVLRWNSFECEGSLCFIWPSDVWALGVLQASFCCRKLYPCWLTWGAAVCSQIRLCLCLPPWQWTKAYGFTSPKSVCVCVYLVLLCLGPVSHPVLITDLMKFTSLFRRCSLSRLKAEIFDWATRVSAISRFYKQSHSFATLSKPHQLSFL